MKRLTARYKGYCSACSGEIRPRDHIVHVRRGETYHEGCYDNPEYAAGRAEGERYMAEVKIYGRELAEEFAMTDELARFNAGEDY